jgi:hypothetical protein
LIGVEEVKVEFAFNLDIVAADERRKDRLECEPHPRDRRRDIERQHDLDLELRHTEDHAARFVLRIRLRCKRQRRSPQQESC